MATMNKMPFTYYNFTLSKKVKPHAIIPTVLLKPERQSFDSIKVTANFPS
jgi:hypothetical protein